MVFSCVSLHCLILYYFFWHCITLSGIVFHFGGIVLNSVSLYCMVLPLPDWLDQPTMCDIVLHVGVYGTELCHCIVCYCRCRVAGIGLQCVILHCMLGGIVLNRVSLHCLVLQLPDGSDRPTYFDIVLHCLVLYCIVWYCIALSGIVLHCLVLYCIVWHCIRLSGIVLHCLALYYSV